MCIAYSGIVKTSLGPISSKGNQEKIIAEQPSHFSPGLGRLWATVTRDLPNCPSFFSFLSLSGPWCHLLAPSVASFLSEPPYPPLYGIGRPLQVGVSDLDCQRA